MRSLAILLTLAACSKTGDTTAAAAGPCAAYAQRTAELMAVGFERGAAQAKYVRPELLATMTPPLVALCAKLPAAHTACVAKAATAADADGCRDSLSDAQYAEVTSELQRATRTAMDAAVSVPASAAECAQLGKSSAGELAAAITGGFTGTKTPSAEALAKLCVDDKWTADFVRCENAGGKSDCRARPNVKTGLTKLIGM